MPAPKKRRYRQQKNNKLTLAQKLPKMARHCLKHGNKEAYQRLMDKIAKQVEAGNSKVLNEALKNAQSVEEHRVLSTAMEEVVDTICLSVIYADKKGYVVSDMTSRLFVIPLIGIIEAGNDKIKLEDDDLDAMTESLRKYGILEDKTNVMLLNNLFCLEELPHEYTKAYRLHDSLTKEMGALLGIGKKHQILEHHRVSAISSDRKPSDTTGPALRFLVGVVSGENPELPEERVMDNENLDPEKDLGIRFKEWGREAKEICSKYFLDDATITLLPEDYFEGIKEGVFGYNQTATLITFAEKIMMNDMDPRALEVTVSQIDHSGAMSVLLKDSHYNNPIDSFLWKMPDIYEESIQRSLESIQMVCSELGIKEAREYEPGKDRPMLRVIH